MPIVLLDANGHVGLSGTGQPHADEFDPLDSPRGLSFVEQTTWQGGKLIVTMHAAHMLLASTPKGGGLTHGNGHRLDYVAVEKRRQADMLDVGVDNGLDSNH